MRLTRTHTTHAHASRRARHARARGGRMAVVLALMAAFSLPMVAGLALVGDTLVVCVCLQDLTLTLLPAHQNASGSHLPAGCPTAHHHGPCCCQRCDCGHDHGPTDGSGTGAPDHDPHHASRPAHPDRHEGHAHITLDPDDTFHLLPGAAPLNGPVSPTAIGVLALPDGGLMLMADSRTEPAPFRAVRGGPPLDGALAAHTAVLRL